MGEKQKRLYSKTPLIEYKEWVVLHYGTLKSEEERKKVFNEYYHIRHVNKFNILNDLIK